jgi:hypothetical protein
VKSFLPDCSVRDIAGSSSFTHSAIHSLLNSVHSDLVALAMMQITFISPMLSFVRCRIFHRPRCATARAANQIDFDLLLAYQAPVLLLRKTGIFRIPVTCLQGVSHSDAKEMSDLENLMNVSDDVS